MSITQENQTLSLMYKNIIILVNTISQAHGGVRGIMDIPDIENFLIILARNNIGITAKYLGERTP